MTGSVFLTVATAGSPRDDEVAQLLSEEGYSLPGAAR